VHPYSSGEKWRSIRSGASAVRGEPYRFTHSRLAATASGSRKTSLSRWASLSSSRRRCIGSFSHSHDGVCARVPSALR
jgi:hypothetical protein